MPTYDYECEACGHAFELFQSMSAPVKRKCPECKKSKLQRLIGMSEAEIGGGRGGEILGGDAVLGDGAVERLQRHPRLAGLHQAQAQLE